MVRILAITAITLMSALQTLNAFQSSDQTSYFLYVGVYGKGIHTYRFDTRTAQIESLGIAGEVVNPSFMATDRDFRFLYAVSELDGKVNGGVAAFAIDRRSGALKFLNS